MEHDAEAVVPVKVHVPPNIPLPLVVNVTTPVGVINVPGEVSDTVTVHVIATPMIAGEEQDNDEDRVLRITLTVVVAFGFAA
jgi:hypothetical protein